ARVALRAAATHRAPRRTVPTRSLAAVRAYWTTRRMAAARPGEELAVAAGTRFTRPGALDGYLHRLAPGRGTPEVPETGARWTGGGTVARTTGKVFFSLGADDYVCSGSAVASPDRSTVLTAGHCVLDPETGTTATNWVFVPGYRDGRAPYGLFAATHLVTTTGWATAEDFDVDLGFADVAPNAAGARLGDAVGGQRIAFGTPRGRATYAFGYPAAAPWTGQRLVACSGSVVQDTSPAPSTDQGLACTMTPGSSGGPWFSDFDPRTGTGTLTSVTSFSYTELPGVLWGPYLGAEAQALYDSVAATLGA
ncbi:MAG TPA: trypsin-like peptidase domain-containing protein, partial [Kineosporiaceae bacterium]|nr:trypsin-like peptidase domain-containing protein [Kineosporiaceae bacterium]